jgi:putative oxidoreductase
MSLVAGVLMVYIFHGTGIPDDKIHLMKNIAMTDGLLLLMLHGAGKSCVDYAIENNH